MIININFAEEDRKEHRKTSSHKYLNLKNRVCKFNSISSNCSNINSNEPLNLAMNKDDSLIYSIVSEMSNAIK